MLNPPRPTRRYAGLPPHVQTASFWLDDSGSRGSAHRGYVIGGVKTRHPDDLQRAIHTVRDKHGHDGELKFNAINERNLARYFALVDVLAASEAHLVAGVLDASVWNPFKGKQHWIGQAVLASDVVIQCLNANEVCAIFMDGISTPADVSMGRLVKRHVNGTMSGSRATSAVSLNSKTNDLLQAADLVAGAVRYMRFEPPRASPKSQVALRLCSAFGVPDLTDRRAQRVRIHTVSAPPATRRKGLKSDAR